MLYSSPCSESSSISQPELDFTGSSPAQSENQFYCQVFMVCNTGISSRREHVFAFVSAISGGDQCNALTDIEKTSQLQGTLVKRVVSV